MLIKRTSTLTGNPHILDLAVTEEQIRLFERGELVQNAFPQLNAEDREFILSGITAGEWNEVFGSDDDE